MERLDLLRNLMVMALADGKVTESELRMLSGRAVRWGIGDKTFEESLDYAMSPGAHLVIPGTRTARMEMLRELLRMMAVDGELADMEKQLFAIAAATMKIDGPDLDSLLDTMLQG